MHFLCKVASDLIRHPTPTPHPHPSPNPTPNRSRQLCLLLKEGPVVKGDPSSYFYPIRFPRYALVTAAVSPFDTGVVLGP